MQNTTSRILSLLLALVMVLSMVPTVFAAEDSASVAYAAENTTTGAQYESINDAIAAAQAGQIVKALADAEDVIYNTEGVILDLNGHDLSVTAAEGVTLSAIDSATDDYEGDYGSLTTDGTVAATVKTTGEVKSYVTIAENGSYTFHRYYAAIAAISLKPTQVALGYRAEFRGDEAVKNAVTGYGYEMWLNGGAHKTYSRTDALEKSSLTLRLKNILAEGNDVLNAIGSTATIGGNAFITLNLNGEEVKLYGTEQETTLRQVVESVNANVSSYGEAQLESVRTMITTYASWMEGWATDAIFGNGESEGDGTGLKVEITVDVTAENGVLTQDATLSNEDITVTVPQGTTLEDGTTQLTLTITEKASSDSGVTAEEDETLLPLDVHIEGISADNTTPILVCLGEVLPKGLNIGNYQLYHVENGQTVEMTHVLTLDELDTHNEFHYDPATGAVTVAMASFSEITLRSIETGKWENGVDHTWYTANPNADQNTYCIYNADQLWSFSQIVGGMAKDEDGNAIAQEGFAGKTVILHADLDMNDLDSENGYVFYPIGYWNSEGTYDKSGTEITSGFYAFQGTFDGNGHTIANFYQNTWEMKGDHNWYAATAQHYRDGMGLFGKVYGGTVKNLTVKNFSSDGEITTTGTIAAYADNGAIFENISIFNCNPRVYNIGNGGIVGCVGWYNNETSDENPVTFRNITVDNTNKISALWGSWDVACGGLVGQYYPTSGQTNATENAGIYMENCHVAAQIDVNNDVCANYQYYAYRYAGMLIGSVRENVNGTDGRVYPKMDGITAKDCTVHYGTWNDYYYCELVANTLASYTHDHQMSRLTQVASVEGTTITYLDGTTGTVPDSGRYNYVVVKKDENGDWAHATENATCYHFVDGAVWNHTQGGYEETDIDGDGEIDSDVLKEDKQHLYLEFYDQLVTGYGWGVTSKGIKDIQGVTVLDRLNADSVSKFSANEPKDKYLTGEEVTIGQLFKENTANTAIVSINRLNVQVFVSPVGDDSTAGGIYEANNTDWTQGKLTFTGNGAAQIIITDYYYCTTTTIDVTVSGGYTISYSVPAGVDAIDDVEGTKVTLPTPEGEPTGDYDYTFLGWTTEIIPDTTEKPITIYTAGNEYIANCDTMLYALYQYHTDTYAHTEYVLTDIDEIEAEDEVVITMTYINGKVYTLSSANGTSSAPTANTIVVDTENNILAEEPADDIKWNISNNNGTLTIYVNESTSKWLYCDSKNDGVRVGTDEGNTFIVEGDYLKHVTTSRYVGVYHDTDTPNWRCYTNTTGNTVDQTLGFYVKVTDYVFEGEEGIYYTTGICKHTETHTETAEPTCTEDGYNNTVCDNCGAIVEGITIDALGHDWVDGSCSVCGAIRPAGWVLVTDASSLAVGDQIVIVSSESVFAMGAQQTKNRDAVEVEVDRINKTITYVDGVQILTLAEGSIDGTYAFDTGSGYLYAAGSGDGNNHLKTETTLTENSSWTISIEDDVALVIAQGDNDHNVLQYNFATGNELFSCYAGTRTKGAISLYRLEGAGEGTCEHTTVTTTIKEATCTEDGYKAITCAVCGQIQSTMETYPATGHTEVADDAVAPTCTETGLTEGSHCSVCKEVIVAQEEVAALGHSYDDGVVTAPTETEQGYTTYTCTVCDHSYLDNFVPALGINYTVSFSVPNGVTSIADMTCNSNGSIALPTPENVPAGYEFVGWVEEKFTEDTITKPTVLTGSYTAESSITLYAVFSYVEEGAGSAGYVETDLANIKSTDVVVIVGNNGSNYAMSNDNGTGSAPEAVAVTVNGNALTGTIADNIKWNITSGTNGYTIYPNGDTSTWLYCTNTNNGVRVGTNTANVFTIGTGNNAGYLQHSGTSRYLGIYNSQDWRCYTSGYNHNNIGSQTFKFYVLTTGGTTYYTTVICDHSNTTTETIDATCTEAGSVTVTCDDCGTVISTEVIEATGHSYTYTDNEDGTHTYDCDNCEDSGSEDHTYEDGTCSSCDAEEPTGGETTTSNLSFASTSNRTSYSASEQVWTQNGITLTNTGSVADYSNPVRFYASTKVIIECDSMTTIVFNCSSTTYATNLKNSIPTSSNYTVTVSGSTVTIVFTSAVNSFTIDSMAKQVRVNSIDVTHEA